MTNKGFTLAEIIVVLFIVGFLIGSVALVVGRTQERGAVITTLSEMNNIKKTIRERFYPDLGLIPEDAADPEYATRYLCLKNDGAGNPEYQEMRNFLGSDNLMVWDKYVRKGWRGPYMEPDTRYHDLVDDEWYPVLTDAWKNYYHILMNPAQDKDSARIVSFGANGLDDGGTILPVSADIGDDIVMFVFGGGETRSPLD
ncbi:MAG: prepilin-type N-terminal cleavage/methylation domain-containing protein [Deltaproteobacteria bacterium]|nr:prepilin-type N-terminal cleavage/methylation domain-containing protein [Deltaproteobacteria bacterium]MBW2075548.1 prepilin-type N-terminal cleavage/methylation domain-containing protein [Deltaproteobacteria bacterium]